MMIEKPAIYWNEQGSEIENKLAQKGHTVVPWTLG